MKGEGDAVGGLNHTRWSIAKGKMNYFMIEIRTIAIEHEICYTIASVLTYMIRLLLSFFQTQS